MSGRYKPATVPSECRSCHAPILWTTTEPNGKAMPVDLEPDQDGKFIVNHRPKANKLIAVHIRNVDPEALPGRRRYHSHFETCPQRDEHRKPK